MLLIESIGLAPDLIKFVFVFVFVFILITRSYHNNPDYALIETQRQTYMEMKWNTGTITEAKHVPL